MPRVTLNGKTIAESNQTVVVENNLYFPPSSVDKSLLTSSKTSTVCPRKGTALYYNATVDGNSIQDIAWYYPEPRATAEHIKNYVAFYKNKVQIDA